MNAHEALAILRKTEPESMTADLVEIVVVALRHPHVQAIETEIDLLHPIASKQIRYLASKERERSDRH